MAKEFLFTDIAALAQDPAKISKTVSNDMWQAVEYESEKYRGVMLVAAAKAKVPPVRLPLGLRGWFRIFVGFLNIGDMYTYLKLDSDVSFSGLSPISEGNLWAKYETVHEVLWKCAYLDGDGLTLSHPEIREMHNSSLVWVRCVQMTEQEIAEYQKERTSRGEYAIHAHIDTDFMGYDTLRTPEDALCKIQALSGSDVTMLSQEICLDACGYPVEASEDYVGLFPNDRKRNDAFVESEKIKEQAYAAMVDYCEKIGIRLHAAMRMQLSSFQFPITYPRFQIKFADEHPQFYIKTRDGRTVSILSYAYPEVREYMTGVLVDAYRKGFQGITLLWIRGINIGFEEPVLQRIQQRYPGVDARCLPASDPRLQVVWCEFLTEFVRMLRKALDEEAENLSRPRCNLHTVGPYTLEHGRQMGLDIQTWAKEGLIDGLTVGMYAHHENLEGILADDGSGMIDLEKYTQVSKRQYMVKRTYLMVDELMYQGIQEHQALAEQYGIEAYYFVDWEKQPAKLYAKQAKAFYERGAKGICLWDTNGRVMYPPVWHVESKLGHSQYCDPQFAEEKQKQSREIYKVLRLNGHDLSYVNVNWRG